MILLGDFDIDLLKYETHMKTSDFSDEIFSFGLLPVITKPTRTRSSDGMYVSPVAVCAVINLEWIG